jgi:hypothetical protein
MTALLRVCVEQPVDSDARRRSGEPDLLHRVQSDTVVDDGVGGLR